MSRYAREIAVTAALAALLVVLVILAPAFFKPVPLLSLAAREAPALLVAAGMALIIVARQIDVSVASQFAVCSVFAGLLLTSHWPMFGAAIGAIVMGLLLGALNGLLVAGLQLPSIVVTLATMVTWREALRWQRQGRFIDLPPDSQWFGLTQTQGQVAIVVVALAVCTLVAFISKRRAVGRQIYAIGSNAEAARLAGLRPRLLTFVLFAFVGGVCGVAAVLNTIQSPQVDPKAGSGLELRVIAACVAGGVAISGGRGSILGAALGLILLACISPALIHLRLEPYWERALQGIIILLAVTADRFAPVRIDHRARRAVALRISQQ